ncbi:hypothetical protein [Methylobacterium sp. Leaf118]|uniref:hypothetical protein n=1 Tax=Methylobacterium sp. Leaf118 TaxID=2876562 RepID=UPI001E37C726|nr:hypothetical protein [Methylobacterium sp. Leaf118]
MTKDIEELPRWIQRREGRSAGRYGGNKVVRWIARPGLKSPIDGAAAEGLSALSERNRGTGYGMLRLVADN